MAPSEPSGLLILTAVELESSTLARQLELPTLASLPFRAFGRGLVRIAPVGLGGALLDGRWPSLVRGLGRPLVVSAGVCGALDPCLRPGNLVVPGRVTGPAGERFDLGGSTIRDAVLRANPTAHAGGLVTAREVAATAEAKAALWRGSGAAAVDMESATILVVAAAAGCPALVVRGVSDHAGQALPAELLGLITSEGALGFTNAVALALTRPRTIPRAIELGRGTRRALRAVGRALAPLAA